MSEPEHCKWPLDKLRRKADQEWIMASLARQDRDYADYERHTELARLYDQRARELAAAS